MIKLSKTGWNNVIIFAVMGFILLINATNKNLFSEETGDSNTAAELALVGEGNIILTLTVENVMKVERIGKNWRALPENISSQGLEQMMMSWQRSVGTRLIDTPDLNGQFALNVALDIAGQDEAMKLSFYATDVQLLAFNQQSQQWLAMPIAIYGQLFPTEIFISE